MGHLFGSGPRINGADYPSYQVNYSTALVGLPVPIVWGQARVPANVIWYGGFFRTKGSGKGSSGGGKGGVLSSGKYSQSYNYYASAAFAFCEGMVDNIVTLFYNSNAYSPWWSYVSEPNIDTGVSTQGNLINGTEFDGANNQNPWGYLEATLPAQALAYRGTVYLAYENMALGSSPTLPNISAEIRSYYSYAIPALGPDGHPIDVILDFLTNPNYGVPGFQGGWFADLTNARNYCTALGLVVSPTLTSQTTGTQFLQDLATAINCEFVWSSGLLHLVPYADQSEAGNGATFTLDTTPVYDLTIDDFLPAQGGASAASPVEITRKNRALIPNHIVFEYLDRSQYYNPYTVDAWDEASIAQWRQRDADKKSMHVFCIASAAQQSASLYLARQQIATTYKFTLGPQFILLDPMDIVTLTVAELGMGRVPVRITEIQENDDYTLTFTADEYLGSVSAPLYGTQASLAPLPNYNFAAPQPNPPVIFEPPYQLAKALQVWVAVSAQDLSRYGGCNVWASTDNATYHLFGQIGGNITMGTLAQALPAVAPSPSTMAVIDTVNVLNVDLTQSSGELTSVTAQAMNNGDSACWVDGEIIAFEAAELTAASKYSLTPLARGLYDSGIAAHPAGSQFVELSSLIAKLDYTTDKIGQTVYFKVQPYNIFEGGTLDLASLPEVVYKITGSPLTAAVASPENLRSNFQGGFEQLTWDEIEDFRAGIRYKIYVGASKQTAQQCGDQAHPPFIIPGPGTYYVAAYVNPEVGVVVTSQLSDAITIAGNMIVANNLDQWDQQAESWPGTMINFVKQGTFPNEFLNLRNCTAVDFGAASDPVATQGDFDLTTNDLITPLDLGAVLV